MQGLPPPSCNLFSIRYHRSEAKKCRISFPFACDDEFYFYLNHNGTDLLAWDAARMK